MKAEHVTLIKKAIRMLDYMRADMVRILGEVGGRTDHGRDDPKIVVSDLYAAFDAVTDAKNAKPEPGADGKHAVDCPCLPCVRVREFSLARVKLSETEMRDVMTGKLNPFAPDTVLAPLPQPAPPSELYGAFDAAVADAKPVDEHGIRVRGPSKSLTDVLDDLSDMRSPGLVDAAQTGEPAPVADENAGKDHVLFIVGPKSEKHGEIDDQFDPEPFIETLPSSPVAEITEYERRKRELHAQRGSAFGGLVCIARNAAPGVRCMCPRCAGKAA